MFLLSLGALVVGCDRELRVQTVIEGFAQGGIYRVVIVDRQSHDDLKPGIDSLLDEIERSMSLYDPNSRLSRINRGETDTVDRFIAECIAEAAKLSRESDGRYDVTVKPLISAYGFAEDRPVQRPNVDSLLEFVGYEKIVLEGNRIRKLHPGVQIDLNSIAQGATADHVGAWLDSLGLTDYLVEVGSGEIFCRGRNARNATWTVGIDKPIEGNYTPGMNLQTRISISDVGLATSGNYRKYYTDDTGRKIVHTIDARTGEPIVSNLLSATIVAPTSAAADAYGTLCMILGLEESVALLKTKPELQAYLVYSDDQGRFQAYMTQGMRTMVASDDSPYVK